MPSLLSPLFANSIGGTLLLVGMLFASAVALTGALVAVTRTKWGKNKPLAKFVVLSVYAHLLFFFYAYGTKLVVNGPAHGHGGALLPINIVTSDSAELSEMAVPSPAPWDKPPESVEAIPDLLVPPPPTTAPEAAPEKVRDAMAAIQQVAMPTAPPQAPPAPPEPPPLLPKPRAAEPAPPVTASDTLVANNDASQKTASPDEPPKPPDEKKNANDPRRETAPSALSPAASPMVAQNTPSESAPSTRPADGQPVPDVYRHRAANQRLKWALQFGGTPQTEEAVNQALTWLVKNQSPDGRWDADLHGAGRETKLLGHDRGGAGANADTGITGLALLAFLSAGITHLDGHEHRECVQRGLEYLLRNQRSDGCLAGQAELFASMYCHGMATLALGEATAMTGDPRIKPYLEKAIRYTIASQHPTTGGWRYQPGDSGDLSQFGWQLMALKSAEQAGVAIPAATRERLLRFLQSVSSGEYKGLAAYRPGDRPTRTMTAEALACRFFLNETHSAGTREAIDFVSQEPPNARNENVYYWYYATLAIFQSQDERWPHWNRALQDQLLPRQRTDGQYQGSWDPDRMWGSYGGRVYSTAMSALCLEVYYRYLPLYSPLTATRGGEGRR